MGYKAQYIIEDASGDTASDYSILVHEEFNYNIKEIKIEQGTDIIILSETQIRDLIEVLNKMQQESENIKLLGQHP